jgi:ATP/maltotriose-dependent transcriptional regulator MalT
MNADQTAYEMAQAIFVSKLPLADARALRAHLASCQFKPEEISDLLPRALRKVSNLRLKYRSIRS